MDKREKTLRQCIARYRGVKECEVFFNYNLEDTIPLQEGARDIMSEVPPTFGSCVMLSSAWAGYLRDHFSIPAVVVAGDLKICGARVFKYKEKLPEPRKRGKNSHKTWSGHCWIEVGGYVGDLSIFRTAYAIQGPSVLKSFVLSTFGTGRGALLSKVVEVPQGMQYVPRSVLTDSQVDMFIASLGYQLENDLGSDYL